MNNVHHILWAIDLNDNNESIGKKVVALAKLHNAKLTLAYIIERHYAYNAPEIGRMKGPIVKEIIERMEKFTQTLNMPDITQRVEFGSVRTQILKVADEINAGLICIGGYSSRGLARLLGSNASAIARGAKCDVFVIHITD